MEYEPRYKYQDLFNRDKIYDNLRALFDKHLCFYIECENLAQVKSARNSLSVCLNKSMEYTSTVTVCDDPIIIKTFKQGSIYMSKQIPGAQQILDLLNLIYAKKFENCEPFTMSQAQAVKELLKDYTPKSK